MVAFSTMGWLSDMTDNLKRSRSSSDVVDIKPTNLGILAFETAKTMSRILSLYKSLSDNEITKLRNDVIKSEGISYLNSKDEVFLLSLACAEKLEDLDRAAVAVARLGGKCSDFGLNRFKMVYEDLKLGTIDVGKLEYGSRALEKRANKMEKLILETSGLYTALESLAELETSERKFTQWKKNGSELYKNMNFDVFNQKITYQRKQVRRYKEVSLWSQTFDTVVGLMTRTVCATYTRICNLFGRYAPALPSTPPVSNQKETDQREFHVLVPIKEQIRSRSGPIISGAKPNLIRFYSQKLVLSNDWRADGLGRDEPEAKNNHVFHAAGPDSVGGSGLAVRYANLVVLADQYLDAGRTIGNDARENLYEMLPGNLKALVKLKLGKHVRCMEGNDDSLAAGWREPLLGILGWLLPLAQDTLKWQLERNFEKTKFDTKPTVLLLQTLHFADKEKTEAAIAELLVGLSCIYLYENRRSSPES